MDFSAGIPAEFRTFVAVPTMLTSAQAVSDLIEALEVRYLANRDEHLHFGLLTDWRDAPSEMMPDDQASSTEQGKESRRSTKSTKANATIFSSCFIGLVAGTHKNESGWVTSGNAESSPI